jgi:hypothetical protein
MKILLIKVAYTNEQLVTDGELDVEVGEYILNDLEGKEVWLRVTDIEESTCTAHVVTENPEE